MARMDVWTQDTAWMARGEEMMMMFAGGGSCLATMTLRQSEKGIR